MPSGPPIAPLTLPMGEEAQSEGAGPWEAARDEAAALALTEERLHAHRCTPGVRRDTEALIQVGAPSGVGDVATAAEEPRGRAKDRRAKLAMRGAQ